MRNAEGYRVDIGTAQPAILDGLAFEGATKRSKPNLKVRLWLSPVLAQRHSGLIKYKSNFFPCLIRSALSSTLVSL